MHGSIRLSMGSRLQRLHLHRHVVGQAHLSGSEFNVDVQQRNVHVVSRNGVSQYDLHLSAVAPGGYDLYLSGHITALLRP
jgi:hypothetical protein